jgi:hypothetical protein
VDDFKLKVSGISTTSDMARDEMASKLATGAAKPGVATPGAAKPAPAAPTIERFGGR